MDEDLSIINTNTRNEKIKNFFVNNKNKIISGIIILNKLNTTFLSETKSLSIIKYNDNGE